MVNAFFFSYFANRCFVFKRGSLKYTLKSLRLGDQVHFRRSESRAEGNHYENPGFNSIYKISILIASASLVRNSCFNRYVFLVHSPNHPKILLNYVYSLHELKDVLCSHAIAQIKKRSGAKTSFKSDQVKAFIRKKKIDCCSYTLQLFVF